MTAHQPFISYSRGFAITTIILFHILKHTHLPGFLEKAIYLGGAGVHMFFFASGYGLMASRYKGIIDFYTRRFRKILIPYFFIVTVIFLLNIPLKIYPDGWQEYLGHIFFYKMFTPKISSFGGQLWYMSIIIQFYLFFPIIYDLYNKTTPRVAIGTALVISLIYSAWVIYIDQVDARQYNSFFLQYLWEFVLGMAICRMGLLEKIISRPLWVYIVISILGYAIMGALVLKLGLIGKMYNDYFSFLAYLSVCIMAYRVRLFTRILFYLDSFSFSLYLTHYFIIYLYLAKVVGGSQLRFVDLPIVAVLILITGIFVNHLLGYLETRSLVPNGNS